LGRLPHTHYDCYSAWLFGPYHSRPYSYHFADSVASETDLSSYLVDVFVEAFAAVVLAWNGNFADRRVSLGIHSQREAQIYLCMCDILHDMPAFAFAPLSVEHVPEQAPPFIKETALWALFREIRRR